MCEVILIGWSHLEFQEILYSVNKVSNVRLNLPVDMSYINLSADAKTLIILEMFKMPRLETPSDRILRSLNRSTLESVQYTFFICCEEPLDLPVISWHDTLHIFKVDLFRLLRLIQTEHDPPTRIVLNKVQLLLEQRGLGLVFDNFQKIGLPDGSFRIEKK